MTNVYATSDGSLAEFPQNAVSDFTIRLPQQINFDSDYEVCLRSIQFPKTYLTFETDERIQVVLFTTGIVRHEQITVKHGYYQTIMDLMRHMNGQFYDGQHGIGVNLDPFTFKVSFTSENYDAHVSLGDTLKLVFGYNEKIIKLKKGEPNVSNYVSNISRGRQFYYIYAPQLVEESMFNDTSLPLLAALPIPTETQFGEIVFVSYKNPTYVPVRHRQLNYLNFLLTDERGKKSLFTGGILRLHLQFRKIKTVF